MQSSARSEWLDVVVLILLSKVQELVEKSQAVGKVSPCSPFTTATPTIARESYVAPS